MAFPTAVNDQITDAVTQANVKVLGDAPALAMGNLYQATAQALSNAAHNATTNQQQSYITSQAATTMGIVTLYSIDTASTGVATKEIWSGSRAKQPEPQLNITADMVIGHIQSILNSPTGKQNVKAALEQAVNSTTKPDMDVVNNTIESIKTAIGEARNAGVIDQIIAYILHEVAHDQGINMLYPTLEAQELKEEEIYAYYGAIVVAYRKDNAQ